MRALLLVLLVLATVLAQVAIAPLLPLAAAFVQLPVVMLLLLAVFAGPHPVMIALPVLVLFLGFSTNVDFEWLVVAYLPILPCAAWIQRQRVIPQTPYTLVLLVTVAAGIWARAILAGAAMTSGASPAFGPIFSDILLPGTVLDAVVLSVVYGTCRWIGWPTRSLDLERAGF